MIFTIHANRLLDAIYMVSKTFDRTKPSALLLINDTLFGSGPFGASQYKIDDIEVLQDSYGLIPISIIPYLQIMSKSRVNITLNNSNIVISSDNGDITIPQYGNLTPEDTVINNFNGDLSFGGASRIKDIMYATGTGYYDNVFVSKDGVMITANGISTCVYKPTKCPIKFDEDMEDMLAINTQSIKLLDNLEYPSIAVVGDMCWIGDKTAHTSFSKSVAKLPDIIMSLIDYNIDEWVIVNRQEFERVVSIANANSTSADKVCSLHISKLVRIMSNTEKGTVDLKIGSIDSSDTDSVIDINVSLLYETIKSTKDSSLMIGISKLGKYNLFTVIDDEVKHYIVSLKNKGD